MNWKMSEYLLNRWVVLTLLLGVLVTFGVSYQIYYSNQSRIKEKAQEASHQVFQEIVARIRLYQYGLRGARGAVVTAGETSLRREDFKKYSLTRDINVEFPGARGFGFIRRVPVAQEANFIAAARQDGWPNFTIKTLYSNFTERYVIQYLEPMQGNSGAIGLDIASEQNRREAATSSLYTGEVRLTAPITLVQASGKPEQSFLILMPIYSGGSTPTSQAERIKTGFGWSYAPLLMEEVLSGLAIDVKKVRVSLQDITDRDEQISFYDSGSLYNPQYEHTQTAWVFGRQWQSKFVVSPAFVKDLHLPNPVLFLIQGLIINLLAAILVAVVRLSIARNREVISYQSKITAVVESSADAIISKNLQGQIDSWNKGAEHLFGFTAEEALGNTVQDLLVPISLKAESEDLVEVVKQKKQALSVETRRVTKYGTEVPVSVMISPIFDGDHAITGISQSIRDMSEHKKAQAKIQELNTSLENQVKERTAELRELNYLLSEVLNASSEVSIIATDLDGNITLFNRGAEKMLCYSAAEVVGHLSPVVFHCDTEIERRRKAIYEETGKVVSTAMNVLVFNALQNDSDSQEWTYLDKFGHPCPVSLAVTPMKNSEQVVTGFLGIAMSISEQKKTQQALTYARDQLLMAANVARLGIWSYNIETSVLEWNDLMYDLYQVPLSKKEEGIVYDDWFTCVHPDDKDKACAAMKSCVLGEKNFDIVFRILLPGGSTRHIEASASLQEGEDGKRTKVMGINRDITQERELEHWLRKAKNDADATSAAKSSFLANMSHEIRTPMSAILGMLHLAKRTPLTAQQRDYITKAHVSAQSLLGLINDILDFSKVDAGKMQLEKAPFELAALLSELSAVMSSVATEKNIELDFDIDSTIPPYLLGDRLRLLQVLINLLSNAVKFTLQGRVVLSIEQTKLEDDVVCLLIAVKDTGIGIAKEQLDSIFDVFSQAESSTARRFGGSGLGLVISRRFVELMGGKLQVKSELDKGSCFYFTIALPIVAADHVHHNEEREVNEARLVGLRILLVEDNAFNQQIASELLTAEGAEISVASSGLEGVSLVLDHDDRYFDVVLMDMQMPGMDGLEATRQIRRVERFRSLPIIAMTANVSQADRQQCFDAGMNDHIGKPLDIEKMIQSIAQNTSVLQHDNPKPMAETTERKAQMIEKAVNIMKQEVTSMNQEYEAVSDVLDRFGGSVELFHSVVEAYREESSALIVSIHQAILEGNHLLVREHLHSLKGASLTLGLSGLAKRLAEWEAILKASQDQDNIRRHLEDIGKEAWQAELDDAVSTMVKHMGDTA
ncbi:CHASE domain-containing protein [Marinomonas sp. A79]|uniref:histidine kinase n=1 Tax=Marinomonas vulgaris TaxID=2823372 RepID=A0ABS5HCG7_9GAMM|nr:CHASE domain-containing protein [Marinomonas vulgaris]MBR7889170.1 CHASE domain-containing protein [Marinomonas vulgaris]